MVYNLVNYNSVILEQKVPLFDFNNPPINPLDLARNLLETMRIHRGIGMSANQVGLAYRVFVMEGDPPFACFNPKIVDMSQEQAEMLEGCISYPTVSAKITRPGHIRVRFTTPEGQVCTKKFTGMTARIFQHELDHLEGVSFLKKMGSFHRERALRQLKKYTRRTKNI